MLPNLRYILPILGIIILTTIIFLSSNDVKFVPSVVVSTPSSVEATIPDYVSGFLVHTSGCRIPFLDAFDQGIKKYLEAVPNINCSKNTDGPLVQSNTTSIWINANAISPDFEDYKCCYRTIARKKISDKTKSDRADDEFVESKTCVDFENATNIFQEFIKIQCFQNGSIFYEDYHGFIIPKNAPTKENKTLNVLMIGADAVSRLNFYRQLPKTLQFLKSQSAIELVGYNKVDDNTFPNLVPVLAGKSVDEIKQDCWKDTHDVFDDCPFIWKDFHKMGYQTGFGEDACWMGVFQYLKSGFFQQPVDNYLHTMIRRAEDDLGHEKKMNAKLCVGPRLAAEILFSYAEKFAVTLTKARRKFFGFFWGTSLTHDYLNVPPQTDDVYETLLKNLLENKVLDKTLVVFMSDHGIRWGPIRETYQGRVEERLPLVFFLVPKWFRETYPAAYSNLNRNRRMLTSPYDLHETLRDIVSLNFGPRILANPPPRGISLFQAIPETRTCEDAGIPEIWCTCHQSSNISTDDPLVRRAAASVVDHLNDKLSSYIQCAQLTLLEVKSAMLEAPRPDTKSSKKKHSIQDITVLLVTSPGLAEFEATVRRHLTKDTLVVLGSVSRINTYGSQSQCMDNYQMRLYCFCV